jgi:hypothetical protein
MVHWYQLTQENVIDLGKAVALTVGFIIGTKAAIAASIATGGLAGVALLTPIPAAGAEYYNQMKKLHGLGARGDDIISPGARMIATGGGSCTINNVYLNLLDKNYNVVDSGKNTQYRPLFWATIGASVIASQEGTDNAATAVHWWYDVGAAVRYQVMYVVTGNNCVLGS